MNDSIISAVRHDLQALVHDLGMYLSSVQGGSVAHNQEIAADYLIKVMDVQGDDTVTSRMLHDVQVFVERERL
jgi:hypothetical protein